MSDKHKKRADEALPCEKVTRLCNSAYEEVCYGCEHRDGVESALRQTEIEALEWALSKQSGWSNGAEHIRARIRALLEAKDG